MSTGPNEPLITRKVHDALLAAARAGVPIVTCSLDLDRTTVDVRVDDDGWSLGDRRFAFLSRCKDRTIYYWAGTAFEPVARYTTSLIKLVPTDAGPPTFEIDGIKMLPTARVSPYADAESKVALIEPGGKRVLDTCGGLGYFAAWCVQGKAAQSRFVRKECGRAVAAQPEPVVTDRCAAADARPRRRRAGDRRSAEQRVRRRAARSAALWHCRRALFAEFLLALARQRSSAARRCFTTPARRTS